VQFGAVENDFSDQKPTSNSTSESTILQLTNTVTTIEKSVEKTTKKVASQAMDFMDDLFGFDNTAESEENTQKAFEGSVSNQIDAIQSNDSTNNSIASSNLLHHDESQQMQVISLPIPKFQKLAQISGDLELIQQTIDETIQALEATGSVWLEIIYTGDEVVSELREHIQAMVDNLPCEVLKIKNTRTYNKVLNQQQISETLQDLNEEEVFERCLTAHNIPDEQKLSLRDAYDQIVYNLRHEDTQAE